MSPIQWQLVLSEYRPSFNRPYNNKKKAHRKQEFDQWMNPVIYLKDHALYRYWQKLSTLTMCLPLYLYNVIEKNSERENIW